MSNICIMGGNGYVGAHLVPMLLKLGHKVTVLDLIQPIKQGAFLSIVGDVRHRLHVRKALDKCDIVIHLACLSNDPSANLDAKLTKSINLDCFPMMMQECRDAGIKRFIYASSSSVYGVREEHDVIETTPLTPLTDYSRYKVLCETILQNTLGFEKVTLRPATICGYSENLRLDLCVHILTMQALRKGEISVYGGSQYRPNIHIDDICAAYIKLLDAPNVDGEIFNCGTTNLTIMETADMICDIMGSHIKIKTTPTDDLRSYHVSSQKINEQLGFYPKKSVGQAILEIKKAYDGGLIMNPDDSRYHRMKSIKEMGLS